MSAKELDPSVLAAMRRRVADKGTSLVVAPEVKAKGAPPPRGTRRKFNAQRQEEYLDYLSRGMRRGQAASIVGVSYRQVADARRIDPAFVDAEKAAEAQACEAVENVLWEVAQGGNMLAIMYYLGNRAPERWRDVRRPDKVVVQHEGQIGLEIEAGDRLSKIRELELKLAERAALRAAPLELDEVTADEAEIVEDDDET